MFPGNLEFSYLFSFSSCLPTCSSFWQAWHHRCWCCSTLSYVSQFHFLGLIFDSCFTWRHHCMSLSEKCAKDLRPSPVIGVLILLLCVAFISTLFAPSFFMAPHAARVILGVLHCTTVIHLESAVHFMPPSLCRRRSHSQYACCVLSVLGNPFCDITHSYYHFYFYSHQLPRLPVSCRIFHELQQLGLIFRNILSVPFHTRYRVFSPPVYRSLHTFNKDSIAPLHWRSLYSFLLSQYQNYTEVFCDGSLQDILSADVQYGALPSYCKRIFLLALPFLLPNSMLYSVLLLNYVSTLPEHFPMLTDSFSFVTALSSHNLSSHYLVSNISSLLSGIPLMK